ncbi:MULTISPECIES: FkbM family methyltransferase [unclassified Methanoculleus]|jgi:FkbM family methyltransferase|uniref:FkbM family methyltransferase n=1 Tax=unclassified Methanoculleus TaxID=2619537 RepID=UPI0025F405A5|nr:FkbM family methyltransferase [Methanoculleus sp. UBA377]
MARKDVTSVVAYDDITFRRMPDSADAVYVVGEYRIDDIRPDERVLDIGANVGAFCIRAARRSRRVLAVEPILTEALRENVRANGVDVTVFDGALGDGSVRRIAWGNRTLAVKTRTLEEFIDTARGCDFLKCDCEGAEWSIRPGALDGVRRIEMELHMPPIGGPVNRALLDYIGEHYDFTIDRTPGYDVRGVMGILHAARKNGKRHLRPQMPGVPVSADNQDSVDTHK